MNDITAITTALDQAGIEYKLVQQTGNTRNIGAFEYFVRIEAGNGYPGCYMAIYFDTNRSCLGHGIWE